MTEETFTPKNYEFYADGVLPLHAFLNYFQEAAGRDAHSFGFGMEELRPRGAAWVLTRMQIEVFSAVKPGAVLTLKTWHSFTEKVVSRREFIIKDAAGKTVIKGSTWWIILNLSARRVTRMPAELIVLNPQKPDFAVEENDFRNDDYSAAAPVAAKEFLTRDEDIDINSHVNNTHYIAWAMESLPRPARALKEVRLSFKSECAANEKISAKVYKNSDGSFTHILSKETGKEAFRLVSFWQ